MPWVPYRGSEWLHAVFVLILRMICEHNDIFSLAIGISSARSPFSLLHVQTAPSLIGSGPQTAAHARRLVYLFSLLSDSVMTKQIICIKALAAIAGPQAGKLLKERDRIQTLAITTFSIEQFRAAGKSAGCKIV
ncbi:hypothetical protein K437DRAFT_79807 [Tilletiaria anomala UBC 951]|uniref:Uncharacterized protein n=1 Tax=Tilletiaria anomala (strain ATCC 24038 / CBS 436.72 / UBC 951) TaxID=1037660 RepID=A0A066W9J9_TILAU|nr:uncharacterized protein K437DRAFT_79807 [Tilletiaria anomala UBC 951]KDN49228.1 hypothetical protein K437DRAFT_79807 [Tilletiaria anomala UBC 951]